MAGKRASPKPESDNVFGQARKPAKMLRVGIYARVSTNDQQTLPMQSRTMREYATRRGWPITTQVREVGSGAAKREAREKLLEAARRRGIDLVLVWRLDRWGRSVTDLLTTLQELEHRGVGFVSLTEALDLTTPAGRAMAGSCAGKRETAGPAGSRDRTRCGNPETTSRRRQPIRNRPPPAHRSHLRSPDFGPTYFFGKYPTALFLYAVEFWW